LGDETKKGEILDNINLTKGLNLSAAEMAKFNKEEFIGLPFNQIKSALAMPTAPNPADMPGIPVKDSANNELVDWLRSVTNVYAGGNQNELQDMLLIKGDNESLYPVFKNIKFAFKRNQIYKFRIVTNGQPVPVGSELYNKAVAEKNK